MFEFMMHMRRAAQQGVKLDLYENGFFPVSEQEIRKAEQYTGRLLPSQLRTFYEEIGWGRLQTGRNGSKTSSSNDIASPDELVSILNGTSNWLMPYSQLQPGVLPFFQRDLDLFLCLHPNSENPNAVHWMWGEELLSGGKICDSLVEFFQRLVEDSDWFNPSKP